MLPDRVSNPGPLCTDAVMVKVLNVGRKVGENSADPDQTQSDQHSHFAYHPGFKTGVRCPLRPRCKICVKTAENEKSWSYKPLAAPIATSEIVLLYALYNFTKRSGKSF